MITTTLIRWLPVALSLALPGPLAARPGVVATREGRLYDGQIRLESNTLVVVNVTRDYRVFVSLSNLLEVNFKTEPVALRPDHLGRLVPSAGGGLPGAWEADNVGSVATAGAVRFASEVLEMDGGGTNVLGDSDAFFFVHKAVGGRSEIVARILHVRRAVPWAVAGLMMRESLRADAPHVFLGLQGSRGGVLRWREAAGADTQVSARPELAAPLWLRLKRVGHTFTASKSRNGRQWDLIERRELSLATNFHVGLAVAGVREGSSAGDLILSQLRLDQVREGPSLPMTAFVPRVALCSGSLSLGRVLSADPAELVLAKEPVPASLPTALASSLQFQWVPDRLAPRLRSGRPGALLAGGEFIEGEFRSLETDQAMLSTVLFGLRAFDVNCEVLAITLRPPTPAPHQYEVRTVDGSVWLAGGLEIGSCEVILQEASLGRCRLPIHELEGIRRLR